MDLLLYQIESIFWDLENNVSTPVISDCNGVSDGRYWNVMSGEYCYVTLSTGESHTINLPIDDMYFLRMDKKKTFIPEDIKSLTDKIYYSSLYNDYIYITGDQTAYCIRGITINKLENDGIELRSMCN